MEDTLGKVGGERDADDPVLSMSTLMPSPPRKLSESCRVEFSWRYLCNGISTYYHGLYG